MPEYDELYRLSDQDFVNVGCTKEELEHVKQYNQELNELNARQKGQNPNEISAEDRKQKRSLQEMRCIEILCEFSGYICLSEECRKRLKHIWNTITFRLWMLRSGRL